MTQDEKVELLRQAGVWDVIGFPSCIDKLFELIAAHEREVCAKVCEGMYDLHEEDWDYCVGLVDCAAAIRARGEK